MNKITQVLLWIVGVGLAFSGIVALSMNTKWATPLFATLTVVGVVIAVWTFWIKPFIKR
jgi:hypothetical protein